MVRVCLETPYSHSLTRFLDSFLPYSLLHTREDQYRFPSGLSLEASGEGVSTSGGYAFAGHHEQASLDVAWNRLIGTPLKPHGGNVTQHDPTPTYNADIILEILRDCVSDKQWLYYAKLVSEHGVTPCVGTADGVRAAIIEHLFSGGCIAQRGVGCRAVVSGEKWSQSGAIKMIDLTCKWVDEGLLTTKDLAYICRTLEGDRCTMKERRKLLVHLGSRRKLFVNSIAMANYSITDTIHNLGSTSTLTTVRATCAAHEIPTTQGDTKGKLTDELIGHITRGNCAEKLAAGCERVVKDASPVVSDVIHTQLSVLRCVGDALSANQLRKVLDLHGIAYKQSDSRKMLRLRLRTYLRSLENGKVKDADDERDVAERLQKLDVVRKTWPKLIPPRMKEKLIKDFKDATSSSKLASFTCACCARDLPVKERQCMAHTDVKMDVLRRPTSHWNDPEFAGPPGPFVSGPLENLLLDANGIKANIDGTYRLELCSPCLRGLQRESVPKHALANRLYLGPVPPELGGLTMVEECMIARARAKSWIVKLQETDTDSTTPTAQRALKGHTIIYPQQPDKLVSVLPQPIDETLTFICIVFVGSSTLTKEWLRAKAKPLIVRREKVQRALAWLKVNNPLYKDIQISEENLQTLPQEDVLPYHIERVAPDDAQEILIARYDNSPESPEPSSGRTHFESVVVTDVDAHTPAGQLRAAAVRHAKSKCKPFVQISHGSKPLNEFFNVDLFPMLYPTLFPFGCGGFEDGKRCKPLSLQAHVKYLFSLRDRRFQTHYSFLFTVFNIIQRRALLLHASLKVKRSGFSRFARDFSSVSSDAVSEILQQVEKGERVVPRTDDERRVLRLMKEVNLVTAKVPGSSASRVAMRNEIRALTMTHGVPSFYITINPADTHNPIVKFLAEGDIDVDNMLEEQVPNFWDQSLLVSSNPAIGAKFFNLYLKAFLLTVLGYDEDEVNVDGGVLGTVKAHYGCVEAQGRGSLHCHMLVWIEGALNPDEIRRKVIDDPSWGQRLLEYLDDTITNIIPEDPIPDIETNMNGKDPCTVRGTNLATENMQVKLGLRQKDVNRLAERVQKHRHTHTCYKYYKPGQTRTCRFDLKEENFKPDSCVNPETGNVSLRCLDGLVNNFNMTILEAVRCNMDIQFIGSGESAKAMMYYITDYITKSQLKSHVAYAALQLAVKKCEQVNDEDDDFVVKSKRLLQKCAHALISHQEMSAQQVASYLMNYEDHFTSHKFGNLYWASFERFVNRENPIEWAKCTPDVARDSGEGALDDAGGEREFERREEDEEAVMDDEDEEEVSISIGPDGKVSEMADQVSDYTLRPEKMGDMCLWDFVAKTEKLAGRTNMTNVDDPGHDDGEDGCSLASDDDSDNGNDERMGKRQGRGRKRVARYYFLEGHKERHRKYTRMRKVDVIPVPIGPAIPRRDQPEVYERHCRLMLIFFKPWRTTGDLCKPETSWITAFAEFLETITVEHKRVMDNMQVLHECRDSRDDHMQTRARVRDGSGSGREPYENQQGENEIEDVDMTEVLEHLSEIDRMSSRKIEARNDEAERCLGELERAGWYDVAERTRVGGDGDMRGIVLPEGDSLEDEWKDIYEKRKAAWKVEARQNDEDCGSDGTVQIGQMGETDENEEASPTVNSMDSAAEESVPTFDVDAAIEDTVRKWTLNKEQRRAFEIVAHHTSEEKPEQLLMYLGGPGGTGKSRVVNALRDFFELRNETRRFRLAAYTGVAARNVGGATLHSLLQMNESGRKMSAKTKRDLTLMWEGVDYLFVDEVSMIGCEMLHAVSAALTEAKGNTAAFGGVNVIFAGDFAQLPPIGDVRLYKDVDTTKSAMSATNRAQAKVLGRLLWLSVETVVILHETMRQAGCANADFVGLLNRLRDGVCTDADYTLLKTRSLANLTSPIEYPWKTAPIIVSNNAVRDAINFRATKAFAERSGKELHWYHAIDTHKKSLITDPAVVESLEGQHSGQTKHRLRRVPLVLGMPVAVNQNFDVRAGVVNGSWGFLRDVRYWTDEDGRRHMKSCIVEIPGSDAIEMPHLPAHHFPILPDTTDITFEHTASHKRCIIKRKQVPVEPGFALTAHKAQGQTMERVVVDLAGCSGTEQPYVMASRSTSIEGLIVLREFEFSQISKRRSEDLRKEFARLELLKLKTIIKYASGEERHATKALLANVAGNNNGRKRKRYTVNDRADPKRARTDNTD